MKTKAAMKFKPDADLSEDEFVKKYTEGEMKIGDGKEIEEYLRLRHRAWNKKATFAEATAAWYKTKLNPKNQNNQI